MRDKAQAAVQMEKKRNDFLAAGYRLFVEKGIEAVTLPMVAEECGYGTATLYRYFDKKPGFVVAVAAWKWAEVLEKHRMLPEILSREDMTAAQLFEYYLDCVLDAYRKQPDVFRFNQFFNVYARSEKINPEDMRPYQEVIKVLKEGFLIIYRKAEQDHTLRTDMTGEQMFCIVIHLMMAVVTRFAVGLVYVPDEACDPNREVNLQKDMLVEWFKAK